MVLKTKIESILKSTLLPLLPVLIKVGSRMLCRNKCQHQSFLIPGYTGLGNMVLKTPIIRALRDKFPHARIDVLCGNNFGTEFILQGSSVINDILIFPMKSPLLDQLKFYRKIRKRYDTVFLPFDTSHVLHLYYGSVVAGIRNRIGHTGMHSMNPIQLASLSERVPIRFNSHEIHCNYDLLDRVFESQRVYEQYVSVPDSYSPHLGKEISNFVGKTGTYILIQLSVANGNPTPKIWPKAYFQKLIRLFLEKGAVLISVGDKGEQKIAEDILQPFGDKVLNLAGKTSIPDIALLIKNARGLVCHDSGLMHIGNALKTPLIAIFGPSDSVKIEPLTPSSYVIKSDLPCMPCLKFDANISESDALETCPNKVQCMHDITPKRVFEKAVQVFGL